MYNLKKIYKNSKSKNKNIYFDQPENKTLCPYNCFGHSRSQRTGIQEFLRKGTRMIGNYFPPKEKKLYYLKTCN